MSLVLSGDTEERLQHTKIELMTKSVFLSSICLGLKHVVSTQVPTAGTNGKVVYYNPDFVAKLTKGELIGLLAHEVWHVAFRHMLRKGDRDPERWNIAGDHVINLLLLADGFELPEGGCYDEQYTGMTTEQVYNLLPEDPEDEGGMGGDILYPGADEQPGDSPTTPEEVEISVNEIINRAHMQDMVANQNAGNLPAEIARLIEEVNNPKLPWYELLQRFLSDFNKDDYSWSRPNKRFMPHTYLPSQYSATLGHITIAIDTSGSVTTAELKAMLSEIESIRQHFHPETLEIIDCDWDIHNIFQVTDDQDILDLEFTGGGGTSFHPVIEYCDQIQPQALIYFTDLYAESVETEPDYPILWICTSDHPPAKVGDTIYLDLDS